MDAIRSSIDLKNGIEIITVVAKTRHSKFDLFKSLVQSIIESGEEIREQDIIIISSKFLSQSQGNLVKLDNIIPTVKAKKLSEALKMDEKIAELVTKHFDLRPGAIISNLDLRRPIYAQTASYGHFGRDDIDLPWEQTDKSSILRREASLIDRV